MVRHYSGNSLWRSSWQLGGGIFCNEEDGGRFLEFSYRKILPSIRVASLMYLSIIHQCGNQSPRQVAKTGQRVPKPKAHKHMWQLGFIHPTIEAHNKWQLSGFSHTQQSPTRQQLQAKSRLIKRSTDFLRFSL